MTLECLRILTWTAANFCGVADDVREGFDVHFADTYEDVYRVALDYDLTQ